LDWLRVEVAASAEGIDPVCAALTELGVTGFEVRDPADLEAFLEGRRGRWDYVAPELLALRDKGSAVIFYLAGGEQGAERLKEAKEALSRLRELDSQGAWGSLELTLSTVLQEDWETSWKAYYKPVKTGGRLVICPTWEEYFPEDGEVVLRMDPGMAFGSGVHDSTRLCLELLQEAIKGGEDVLDLGCGSGILGIASLLLGARGLTGTDIEEIAIKVAEENAKVNRVGDKALFSVGSLADGVTGKFDVILANIVADVILSLIPDLAGILKAGGVFITSGIIDTRAAEVEDALVAAGYRVKKKLESGGWVSMAAVGA
jgi:ribosomal protein L11 methyltransferase